MESPAKLNHVNLEVNLEDNDDYSESYSEVEEDDFIVDDEDDDIVYAPGYDPDQELQQKRARLDFKLKSAFESIFEKYGRDFEGVGDEIDLRTGEIVVDNGHLKEMQDERDAGDKKAGGNLLRALTVEPESVTETSGDEYIIEEEEGNNERDKTKDRDNAAEMGDGDMEEDDMILRGYDETNQDPFVDMVATTELGPAQNDAEANFEQQDLQSEGGSVSFPSYNEILRSFGPEVTPKIVNIISRQQGQDDSHIEPAWRAPELPISEPRKRPALRAFETEPENERSPSPDMSESIWALPKGRGPRGPYKPKGPFRPRNLGDKILHSDGINTSDYSASGSPRVRNTFTEEEDKILIAKVAEAHDQGLPFGTESIWKELESLNSRHSQLSWKNRYRLKYLHLWSPNSSTRSAARGHHSRRIREEPESSVRSASHSPHPVPSFQRPSRTRRPVQQGSDVVTWSDAVATIKSLDPRLHRDLAKDASAYDLTDIRPVDVDEDALDLKSSDLEFSDKEAEPELPVHIGFGVQRIAPVTVNSAYEFSDEEAEPSFKMTPHSNISISILNGNNSSGLATPQPKEETTKSCSDKSKVGINVKLMSQSKVRKRLMSEEIDELSLSLGGEDVLFIYSSLRKGKQREPQTFIKREVKQIAISETDIIPHPSKRRMSAPSSFDEFDELSAEWPPSITTTHPKKSIVTSETVQLADTTKETNIDLFDINQLPETSPRSVLDARRKSRMNKRFSSGAVIPSTSSQIESSPTVAVDARIQSRAQKRINSVGNGPVSTILYRESSPTPRPKRKFADLDEREKTSFTSSHKGDQETETPVSDTGVLPLQNMINGSRTPTHKSFFSEGMFTPSHSELKRSRTPLLDYTTPTRKDPMRKGGLRDASCSPGMVKTPGGTFRKCGQDRFSCKRAFCFRCGLSSKRMKP
ncbi:hypothetical protein NHQ30_002870 [Ciborinia camelliae]|nr:hypothetical protein NHQ30_002870 [Ciborinia camelliae]